MMAQRHELVVHLGTDTMRAEEGVYLESEVERRTSGRHSLDFALRCEYEYLACEEIELDSVEKVHRIGLRVVKNLLDCRQPVVEFGIVVNVFVVAFLVLPVCCKSLFCHLVHMVGAYLHLNPLALLRHQRHVQSLIAVGFGMVHPVAQSVGVRLVYLAYCHVYLEAFVDFLRTHLRRIYNAHSQDVVYLLECDVLVLHLVPDGVGAFDACLEFVLYSHTVESLAYRSGELCEERIALRLCVGELVLDVVVFVGMLILERKVLQFGLYLVQSESVCQWRIDVHGLAGYLVLLVGWLRSECAHVVQTVAYLNKYDAYVVAHGEQKLLEVFGLG